MDKNINKDLFSFVHWFNSSTVIDRPIFFAEPSSPPPSSPPPLPILPLSEHIPFDSLDNVILDQPLPIISFEVSLDSIIVAQSCECGSDKVGSSRHSTWCCKYTNN